MTDKEIKKLAMYIVDELTKPSDDMIDKLGHVRHVLRPRSAQMEYEELNLKHEIEQLNKLLKINLEQENYEAASLIHAKIKKLENDMKQG